MPVCYLHVGSHKTGTSAIQVFLSKNRDLFDRHRILVPASGTSPNGSHIVLINSMLGNRMGGHRGNPWAGLKAEMLAHPSHDIVISAELLETVLLRDPRRHPIIEFFADAGYEVRVVLYLRNVPQLLNARYSQRVKMFRFSGAFRQMLSQVLAKDTEGNARWIEVARHNRCTFIARPYTGHIQAGGLIEDLVQIIGLNWARISDQLVLPGRRNESVGPTAIAAARRLMARIPGGSDSRGAKFQSWCGRMLLQQVETQGIAEPRFSGFDTASARGVEQHFRNKNERFAEAFWQTSWDDVYAADLAEDFARNELDLDTMATTDAERVDALCERTWPRIERKLSNPRPGGMKRLVKRIRKLAYPTAG